MQITNNVNHTPRNINNRPNFKGNFIVSTMDAIERGGLFASFTVQDMLGTNIPRPIAGLTRNKKENNGKKNTKMALKELIREMTTGPSMFIIPMLLLTFAKKTIGKSLSVPSEFIHSLGDIYKNTLSGKSTLPADDVLKHEYIKNVFSSIISNATDKPAKEVATIADDFAKDLIALSSKKHKNVIQNMKGTAVEGSFEDALEALEDRFISITKHASSNPSADFLAATITDNAGKKSSRAFRSIYAYISDFSDDAIKATKKLAGKMNVDKLPEEILNFTNKRIVTRNILNVGMIGAIVGFLCIIPKLYNSVSKENPGLAGLENNSNNANKQKAVAEDKKIQINQPNGTQAKSPSFGSAASVAKGLLESPLAKSIEFNGIDMSFPVLIGSMLGGVLLPRVVQAKDKYDRKEIILRDTTTIATMGVAAKIIAKIFSKHNENKSGFALAIKPESNGKNSHRMFQYLRPEKGVQVLTSKQIVSKYSDLAQYKDGINGFCQFVDEQGGNLQKIFGFDKKTKQIIEDISGGAENFADAISNKKIMDYIKIAQEQAPQKIEELLEQFKNKDNIFVKKAKTMNSTFGFLTTFLIVPMFLGFGLPKLLEGVTKKKYKKEHEQNPATTEAASTAPAGQPAANAPAVTEPLANSQTAPVTQPAATESSPAATNPSANNALLNNTYKNPYFMAIPEQANSKAKEIFDKITSK